MAAEKRFEDRVKAFLQEKGCYFIKYWGGGGYTKAGVPDLLVCVYGQFAGIELKADKGEPTLLQLVNLQRIRDSGGWGILLYPKDFDRFKDWFDHKVRYPSRQWYLANIEEQKKWKARLEERSQKDGGKEKGNP